MQDKELDNLRDGNSRMAAFVDDGRWQQAPWAEGAFTRRFLALLRRSSLFVDIGAEVGFYSYLALKHMAPEGRIVAFEADPLRCRVLQEFFAPHTRVQILGLAVDRVATTRTLVKSESLPCATMAAVDGQTFEVQSVALDEYPLGGAVDLVKMDIEGAEINALRGMEGILSRDHPTLLLEVHPFLIERIEKGGLRQIEHLFARLGYRLFNSDYEDLIPINSFVGSRFIVCHRDRLRELPGPEPASLMRRARIAAEVGGYLPLRRWVRERLYGY